MAAQILVRLRQTLWHALWPPVAVEAMEQRLEQYLAERGSDQLGAVGMKAEPVLAGRNTLVVRLRRPAGTLYLRAWRYDPAVRPAHEHAHASGLLAQAGLRVPKIELLEDSAAIARRYRLELAAEQAAAGLCLQAEAGALTTPGFVERLGRELARMHAQVGTGWGKPWRPINPAPDALKHWLGRIALFESGLPSELLELPPDWLRARLERLRGELRALDFSQPRLIHGDLAPGHLYLREDGELTWIDFGTVAYGHPAEDLAAVRGWLAADQYRSLLEAYRAAGTFEPPSEEILTCFSALRLLEKLRSRVNKRRHHAGKEKGKAGGREARFREEQLKAERQLRAVWGG